MSTITRHFTWITHGETGMDGWMPDACKDIPLFLPSKGLGVAHDTLEHFSMDGSMEDECLAFGSIWYIRIENGRLRDNGVRNGHSDAYTVASDLADMIRDNDYADLKQAPRMTRASINTEFLHGAREEMKREFLRIVEVNDRDGPFDVNEYNTEAEVADFRKFIACWFDTAFDWIVIGYRKAMRRWNGHGHRGALYGYPAYESCDLFWQLAGEVDKLKGEEGDTLAIHVNVKRRGYSLVVNGRRDWDM